MPTVGEIFREYAKPFLQRYAKTLTNEQKKAVLDLSACKTGILGNTVYKCQDCGLFHSVKNSCGNRHCPGCQNQKTGEWLEKQLENLLPVDYFFATFTIPSELYPLALSHPRELYDAMFQASAHALKTLAYEGKFLGGKIGFTGILHTWKRDKRLHPHIHYIIPGGAITEDGYEWIPSQNKFFVHAKPLMKLYRAALLNILDGKKLIQSLKPKVRHKKWNVYIDHAGNGQNVLSYLSNYVFRVAITDNNIVALNKGKVTFRFKKSKTNHYVYQTIDVFKFINLFLVHILPSGYLKIRYFGYLSNRYRTAAIQKIRLLLNHYSYQTDILKKIEKIKIQRKQSELRCPACKGKIKFKKIQLISLRFHPLYPLIWKPKHPT